METCGRRSRRVQVDCLETFLGGMETALGRPRPTAPRLLETFLGGMETFSSVLSGVLAGPP